MRDRYLLFSGEFFYARGGWNDSPRRFDDLKKAIELAEHRVEAHGHEWWHIVDLEQGKIVAKSEQQAYGTNS